MNILLFGDVVGKPGRRALARALPQLAETHRADLVVVNGENAAGGFGITEAIVREIIGMGAHMITTGNHVWDKREGVACLADDRVLRPANYPDGAPGRGTRILHLPSSGRTVGILNLAGRVFMTALDCPFRTADRLIDSLRAETSTIIVDFHAEATSEKEAMGYYLDGRVSAVIGTHTHVQTADARVLESGTAYITDVGMTGPRDSVIGMDRAAVLERFLTGVPQRFEVAGGPCIVSAVAVRVDDETGRATAIESILIEDAQ
jgi:hypothetical protein